MSTTWVSVLFVSVVFVSLIVSLDSFMAFYALTYIGIARTEDLMVGRARVPCEFPFEPARRSGRALSFIYGVQSRAVKANAFSIFWHNLLVC